MTDPAEVERREKCEDQWQAQVKQLQQLQMFQAMFANTHQNNLYASSLHTTNSSALVNTYSSPSSQSHNQPQDANVSHCLCGKLIDETHTFCHGCGRRNAAIKVIAAINSYQYKYSVYMCMKQQ
jgi:hypothetical protein